MKPTLKDVVEDNTSRRWSKFEPKTHMAYLCPRCGTGNPEKHRYPCDPHGSNPEGRKLMC